MTNPLYQRTVELLEEILPPRLVSRGLHQGLNELGKKPDAVDFQDIEAILKGPVYRHLQVALPAGDAKARILDILETLRRSEQGEVGGDDSQEESLEAQFERLDDLKAGLKPFNLYFEWPETQKLRSQLKLADNELKAGQDAGKLLDEAQVQLDVLTQKLEDHLVSQAKHLGELEAALESLEDKSSPKAKRLDALLGQVREAHQRRQLAGAELDRARRLAIELRKLQEAQAAQEESATPVSQRPGDSELPPEVSDRLRLIDLEGERRELEATAAEFGPLFDYRPQWQEDLRQLFGRLDREESVAAELADLRRRLAQSRDELKDELKEELKALQQAAAAEDHHDSAVAGEAHKGAEVALGVLETTLPLYADIQHLRSLNRWLGERRSGSRPHESLTGDAEGTLAEHWAELAKVEREASPYLHLSLEEASLLGDLLASARSRLEHGELPEELERSRELLETVREAHLSAVGSFAARIDAITEAFANVSRLNSDESAALARTITHLGGQREAIVRVSPGVQAELIASLDEAEDAIKRLELQLDATRQVAGQLVEGGVLDDVLGALETPTDEVGSTEGLSSAPVGEHRSAANHLSVQESEVGAASGDGTNIDALLERLSDIRGVRGRASYLRGKLIAGQLPLEDESTERYLAQFDRDVAALGDALALGRPRFATVSTGSSVLVVAWTSAEHYLTVVVETPPLLGPVLDKLREELPQLQEGLYQNA